MSIDASIALIRFGIGAQPGEIERVATGPRDWLSQQITPNAAMMPRGTLRTTAAAVTEFAEMRAKRKDGPDAQQEARKAIRISMFDEIKARTVHAIETPHGFAERWVDFWANHFTVTATRIETIGLAGPFVREAIRPHVFGSFTALLDASTFHPCMLCYLDNHRSFGPSTAFAKKRKRGLNENLGREVLELHTLGVNGGYTQSDVEALAKALTGWLPGFIKQVMKRAPDASTAFIEDVHEPGAKTLLGKSYAGTGASQAKDMLQTLAAHPSTARHIGFKVARHFIQDDPPARVVDALAQTFEDTGGDLAALARTLIALEEAWSPALTKIKTPQELMVSAARALGSRPVFGNARDVYTAFSQRPFSAPSPAGWPDVADAWMSPDALKKRLEWANMAAQYTRLPALEFIQASLGDLASSDMVQSVSWAESPVQALTLALMSPEFQRR